MPARTNNPPLGAGFSVGASLLAKKPQAPRLFRKHALSLTFFASKLAPTFLGLPPDGNAAYISAWRSLRHLPRKGLRPRHPSSTHFYDSQP
ncbi:hypothetical protein C1X27_10380 [Pseudomonas sp. MPR-AND1B]|nr:hypothetical protein C1X26_20765 [Pseudomonas sp. MPR-R3A]PMY98929.1 hypothetical protein C1X24_07610 [Pseudomonas sp. FW305-124]PMZ71069.1 hypothetical protein C1X25_14725 [Pseudomonas sp. GW247-3R2A]PNA91214.1 hypothetical protein C1X23_18345 [Pseudomonas sp. FW300-E2]PNB03004.1 hypothetical protein C1X27_10380 [Pseudomonas sp. MPR-AND1B]PRW66842.1 hypothetical protein C7A09_21320 [Pseudomonas fluorescens]